MSGSTRQPLPSIGELLLPIRGAGRRARDVTTQACIQWEMPHLLAPACLVATELVVNAVIHAQTIAELRVLRGCRYLMIEVYDGSPAAPVLPARSTHTMHRHDHERGRGLVLIDATADRWGCRHIDGGKVVWAALRHDVSGPLSAGQQFT